MSVIEPIIQWFELRFASDGLVENLFASAISFVFELIIVAFIFTKYTNWKIRRRNRPVHAIIARHFFALNEHLRLCLAIVPDRPPASSPEAEFHLKGDTYLRPVIHHLAKFRELVDTHAAALDELAIPLAEYISATDKLILVCSHTLNLYQVTGQTVLYVEVPKTEISKIQLISALVEREFKKDLPTSTRRKIHGTDLLILWHNMPQVFANVVNDLSDERAQTASKIWLLDTATAERSEIPAGVRSLQTSFGSAI